MKKLDISSITDSSRMPIKKGTLQFLQDSYAEITSAIMRALAGPGYDPAVVYVLYGVVNSGTYPAYNVTAGAVFYNGEIFLIDAFSFSATGSNVAVFSIVQTQYTTDADPVTFTDSAVRSVHNIRKMQLTQGAMGSTIADLGQGYYLNFVIPQQIVLGAPTTGPFAGNQVTITGGYPNLNLFVPAPPTSVNPILGAGSYNIGDVAGTSASYTITFADVGTANFYVMGTFISNGTPSLDAVFVWAIHGRTSTQFVLDVGSYNNSAINNVAFEYILFAK